MFTQKLCLVLMLSTNKTRSGEMKGHGNYKGWREWGDWVQAAVPATADEGEVVLTRTDINSRIKRSQLSFFVKELLAVLCMNTQHHDNPRSLFQTQTAAYSSYAGSVFYPGYTKKIFHRKSVSNVIVSSRKSQSHVSYTNLTKRQRKQ